MKLIVGFNLSSYSHCTSYTKLTTDTGNCCRACGWPFIKSTFIKSTYVPHSRLLSSGDTFSRENFCKWFIILKMITTLVKKTFIIGAQIMKIPSPQYNILSLTCLLKIHPIKLEYNGTLTLWEYRIKMLSYYNKTAVTV